MKTTLRLALLGAAFVAAPLAWAAENSACPPIPGTVESTDTKTSSAQNNTPRVNPTPNPDPESQPPGPEPARVIVVHEQ